MLVKLAAIFFSMILVNNYVLVKFYGICPFLGVSKKLDSAVGMSGAVIFVMFMATAVTFPIQIFILDPAGLSYLQTIVFIVVIASLVQFVEMFLKKMVPPLYAALGIFLPLITTYNDVTGENKKPFTMGGGTYARHFPYAVSFGPEHTDIELPEFAGPMHGANEGTPFEKLIEALKIYILALLRLQEIEL